VGSAGDPSVGASASVAVAPAPTAGAPAAARRLSPSVTLRGGGTTTIAAGALALRQQADDFVEQQADAVEAHLAREGLSLDETRELTYFAILAVESQDWARVEALTGRPLAADTRRQTWEAMMARSQEMRRELQEQVQAGADEDTRWQTIARIEDGYLADYYALTGMNPALLDQLLAASVRDQRAAGTIASLAPDAEPPARAGSQWVRRDPLHPERPPVPADNPTEP
jgi:hypothetical protein